MHDAPSPSGGRGRLRSGRDVFALVAALSLASFAAAPVRAAVRLNEIVAVNQGSLSDEDGASPDWIELHNTGAQAVDLEGWFLTDDVADPTKWRFPTVEIPAGGYLVVFASDKNRKDPDGELHTNFKLSGGGEYLALVAPDGSTVVDAFEPAYPPQFPDIGFGVGQGGIDRILVDEGAPCRWRVPTDGADFDTWRDPGFDDGSWASGHSGVGYEASSGYQALFGAGGDIGANNMRGINETAYVRFTFDLDDPAQVGRLTLDMKFDDGFVAYLNGHPVASDRAEEPVAWDSGATTTHSDGEAVGFVSFDVTGGVPYLQAGTNVLAIHLLNAGIDSSDLLLVPRLSARIVDPDAVASLAYLTVPTPGAANVGASDALGPSIRDVPRSTPRPVVNSIPADATVVADSVGDFSGVQGQDGWSYGYYDRSSDPDGEFDGGADFTPMLGGSSDPDPHGPGNHWTGSAWDYVAPNGSGNPPWTTITADNLHPNDTSPGPEHYAVRRWISPVSGSHTLSGLFNNESTSGDGTTGRIFHNGNEIFAAVTDGSIREFSVPVTLAEGDLVDFMVDTGPNPGDPGADGSDGTRFAVRVFEGGAVGGSGDTVRLPITARVTPTLRPLASVHLHHRVMFGTETVVPMVDDGTGDDFAAGDGVFTGVIETDQLLDGQMLRWRVRAVDTAGNASTDPPFPDPLDSPEYHGTVATNPAEADSRLPILHWFVQNPGAADNRSGTRGSLFFEGEFYDNIQTDLHGQSTAGFPKKSYDVDFNSGARFRWRQGEQRVKDINLLTNWADKSKLRHSVAYEVFARAGAAHHFAFPVRVQQNGSFFSTADVIEDGDDRYLERIGFDGNGALYKMYNRLDGWSAPGAVKKTRKEEGSADLQALVQGLDPGRPRADRERFLFDHVNLPECVNYLAAMVIATNRDHGHKNYYLYRDTEGSGEWSLLTWDMDLSFGHNWVSGPGYFDDTIYGDTVPNESNPLNAGASNRLRDLLFTTPDVRQMFLRRLRSLMDGILQPSSTPPALRVLETRFNELADLVDPPGVGVSDADLDYQKWGSWGNRDTQRTALGRILDDFLPRRRAYLYGHPNNAEIPAAQPPAPALTIGAIDFNPVSGNQLEEFVELRNDNSFAVDLTGWSLSGAIDFDFHPGTVIPAGGTCHVARHAPSFRGRTAAPRGDQRLFVVSGYKGQLSARGETLVLADGSGTVVDTLTYPGAPTALQQFLRITEIHYHPTDPTAAEAAAVPGATADDFEFLELHNTSASEILDLSGARFVDGVRFTFPAGTTLGPRGFLLVVSRRDAFEARHGAGRPVAGEYDGFLDNGGETIRLVDAVDENVLSFDYKDGWFSPTDGGGHSLVILDPTGSHDAWDTSSNWGIGLPAGGSPGAGDPDFAMHFDAFLVYRFTSAERDDPLVTGPEVDLDGDGIGLFTEYSLGLDPDVPDGGEFLSGELEQDPDPSLVVRFRRPRHALDVVHEIETSPDLAAWSVTGGTRIDLADGPDNTELVTVHLAPAGSAEERRYVRLRVRRP